MRYADARSEIERREAAYRIYISKCLQIIALNTVGGSEKQSLTLSYEEFLRSYGKPQPKEKSGEEIVLETMSKLGLHFKE